MEGIRLVQGPAVALKVGPGAAKGRVGVVEPVLDRQHDPLRER